MKTPRPRPARLAAGFLAAAFLLPSGHTANAARTRKPTITISLSATQIAPGEAATCTISTSAPNPLVPISVNLSVGGTAVGGQDFALSTDGGQITIPEGETSASFSIVALSPGAATDKSLTLLVQPGGNYKPSSIKKKALKILAAQPTTAPSDPQTRSTPTAPAPNPIAPWSPDPQSPLSVPTGAQLAHAKEIWLARRTDGVPGSGTADDPYDASTPDNLVARIKSVPAFSTVHLAPGTYTVSGITGQLGLKLRGAGKDVTVLQWNGIMPDGRAMIYSQSGAHGMEVSDMTLDGQQNLYGETPLAINFFDSNDVKIQNIRATNFRGGAFEAFLVTLFCGSTTVTGGLIDGCEVDHFYRGTGGSTLLGLQHGGGGSLTNRIHGAVTNNYIHDCPFVQGLDGGGTRSLYQNNVVDGCWLGLNHDTALVDDSYILNNQFLNCGHYGINLRTDAGGPDMATNACNGFVVANNLVTLNAGITGDTAGVLIQGAYNTNVQVYGNTVKKDAVTGPWQYAFYVSTGPGLAVGPNDASPGLSSVFDGSLRP